MYKRQGEETTKLPPGHRFTLINGKPCPHVTNIITPVTPKIPHIEEHALQGKWLDGCFKNLIDEGIFAPLVLDAPKTLNIAPLSDLFSKGREWVAKWVKYGEIEFMGHSRKVFNKEYWFCGELDSTGLYHSKQAIHDFKKTKNLTKALAEKYFIQMGGYSLSDELPLDPVYLVICSPYNPPMATEDVKGYQNKFLALREKYRKEYGV